MSATPTEGQERYIDKINKLLRKAEDRATPEAERDTCIRMAQNLMSKWAIDDAMLQAADPSKIKDDLTTREVVCVGIWLYALSQLAWNVIRANDLRAVLYKSPRPIQIGGRTYKKSEVYKVVGYESDINRFEMLYTSLQIQCIRAEEHWWAEHEHEYAHLTHAKQHVQRRGFMYGFASGVYAKLMEGKRAARTESAKTHGTGMELVLLSRSEKVDKYYKDMFPHLRKIADRMNRGGAAAHGAGHEAGRRADTGGAKVGGREAGIELTT